ncbi:imidazole glycerol phosphate synthase subunit HisF [Plesiocystis pacifica SIR-1]|uniref:Imidazole glycerol phosphate synthase subunit HisF n=1 Tax=Plesiocystis pacifica SIR-1 TaxID=391625 RepID=A6G5R6_9BACT|nr:imidazole glycerol phosphate synthase subunit HisF [Plesiocystis pacifica SIR-1]
MKRRIIPCLDVKNGRVVKGVHFKGLRDAGDPIEAARAYDRQGADELCLLDITATTEGRETFVEIVRSVAPQIFCPLTVGGGIRREDDVRRLLNAGADKVAINSAAVSSPPLIERLAKRYGSQAIVVAVDVRRMPALPRDEEPLYEVVIHGGSRGTGLEALRWCEQVAELGAGEILLTSMDKDGTRDGYDLWITREVARRVNIPVIASGGVGSLEHIRQGLALGEGEADAALAASIFHFGLYTIAQTKQYLTERGIPVRPPEGRRAA